MAVRKDLPNLNTGRNTLMLDQPSPRLRLGRPFHAGVAQQRQQQFRKLPGEPPHESASLSAGSTL